MDELLPPPPPYNSVVDISDQQPSLDVPAPAYIAQQVNHCVCLKLVGRFFLCTVLIGLGILIFAFPISVGTRYEHEPCANNLALWLIIWSLGSFALVSMIPCISNDFRQGGRTFSCPRCCAILLPMFLIAWLILGTVWTFEPGADHCNAWIYRTSQVVVIANWCILGIIFSLCCCFNHR